MDVFKPWFPDSPRSVWARAGGFLFCGVFLCGGALCLYQMTIQPAAAWWRASKWERTTAIIESSELLRAAGSEGGTVYSIGVRYAWDESGRTYRGSRYGFGEGKTNIAVERMREEVKRLAVGSRVDCWVNPENPQEAVLVRSLPSSAVMGVFFSLPFLTVGILGTGWCLFGPAWLRRIHRRQAETLQHLRQTGRLAWPWREEPEAALDSGEFRLIFARNERAVAAGAVTALNLFWNGIVAVFVLIAISEATGGDRGMAMLLGLFLLPFIAIGGGMAWFAWVTWRNFLRPDWVFVIQPVPGLNTAQCRFSFAGASRGRVISWDFNQLRLVAMAAPWDSESNRPQRSPLPLIRGAKRRPSPRESGKPPKKEHELASLVFPLPREGEAACVLVPAMPSIAPGSKKSWGRYWLLEIEHRDGRLESFELSTEKAPIS